MKKLKYLLIVTLTTGMMISCDGPGKKSNDSKSEGTVEAVGR